MSIRLSLYDFFAYMIPGVFYILITLFGLVTFNIISLDGTLVSELTLFTFVILLGAGYVLGQLMDVVANRWLRLWKGRGRAARIKAFATFAQQYPWIDLQVKPEEWSILLQTVKTQSPELKPDVEEQMAVSIMMRNISLGLFITALLFLLIFLMLNTHIGNLALAIVALTLSIIALERGDHRRYWFYLLMLELFATHHLLQENTLAARIQTHIQPEPTPPAKMTETISVNTDVHQETTS